MATTNKLIINGRSGMVVRAGTSPRFALPFKVDSIKLGLVLRLHHVNKPGVNAVLEVAALTPSILIGNARCENTLYFCLCANHGANHAPIYYSHGASTL